jgi:hypothetical protein
MNADGKQADFSYPRSSAQSAVKFFQTGVGKRE